MAKLEVKVPDLGDFKDVEIVEVLVKAGDTVRKEQSLIVLETDKAAMEVPAPAAGTLSEIKVSQGGRVSTGDLIALMEVAETAGAPVGAPSGATPEPATPPVGAPSGATTTTAGAASAATGLAAADGASVAKRSEATGVAPEGAPTKDIPPYEGKVDQETELLVLGAGPGGYTAAFRAADLGLKVTLVERWPTLGGVCLNVGCIPSKALLHAAKVIEEAESFRELGLDFGQPKIDAGKLKAWKDKVVGRLTGGLVQLAKQRKVTVVRGTGRFVSPHHVAVENEGRTTVIGFRQCIIAAGSESARIPGLPDDPRVIDSTGALELDLPKSLLVVGGGIIGLEMATVYDALGVKVSVVELLDQLMPGVDPDLLRPLEKRIRKRYADVRTGTKVAAMKAGKAGIEVSFEKDGKTDTATYDRVLVAVGRTPNGGKLDAGKAGVNVSERGFIPVDKQQRTNVPHIFAIGDIVGQPMLAHKATHEGKVAAEVAAGHKRYFDARVIPSVAYTDPEVAWVGLTEAQAKAGGIAFEKGSFPWAASGRSLALNRDEGLTKLLFDPATKRVLGAGIVGPNAGDLISEVALAIELGADAEDIGLTVHPHPTLSETVAFAAEAFDGTLTDLYLPRKK